MYAKDTPPLSIRAKQVLIDKLTAEAEKKGTTRTKLINEALSFFVEGKVCYFCGERNNGNGDMCSVCHTPLYSDDEIHDAARSLLDQYIVEKSLPTGKDKEGGYYHQYDVGLFGYGAYREFQGDYCIITESGDVFVSPTSGCFIFDKEGLKKVLRGEKIERASDYVKEVNPGAYTRMIASNYDKNEKDRDAKMEEKWTNMEEKEKKRSKAGVSHQFNEKTGKWEDTYFDVDGSVISKEEFERKFP